MAPKHDGDTEKFVRAGFRGSTDTFTTLRVAGSWPAADDIEGLSDTKVTWVLRAG